MLFPSWSPLPVFASRLVPASFPGLFRLRQVYSFWHTKSYELFPLLCEPNCFEPSQTMRNADAMLQLILEQPNLRKRPVALKVREDMKVNQLVSSLVERLHIPTRDARGTHVSYQLYTVAGKSRLPAEQRLLDLHLQSGTRVYLDADAASRSTVPVTAQHPLASLFRQRMDRRVVLTLMAFSAAGALSGASTAVAQRVWGGGGRTPPPVAPARTSQSGAMILSRFTGHTSTVRAVAWSPDGTSLCSGADDAMLLLWLPDGTVKQRVTLPDAIRSLSWSPGGMRIAAASGTAVAFLQAQTGQVLALPRAHVSTVTSVSWSAHAESPLVSGSLDKRVLVWQTQDYQPQGIFTKHTAAIDAVTTAPGDSAVVASSSEGGLIRMWNLDTLQEVHGFYQDVAAAMLSAAFAPDGIRLAIGGQDGIVRVWGRSLTCQLTVPAGGEQRCADVPVRIEGHSAPVRTLAWSSDGRYLATGGDDAQVLVWDSTANFTQVTKIAHNAPVHAASWSPTQHLLATASGNTVQIWKLQNGNP